MIGTGIFIVPANMARSTGSVELVILAWVAGGLLTLFGALSAAELSAAIPEAGGTYAYMNQAYGPAWGFLFGWMYSILGAPTSIATISAGLLLFGQFLIPALGTPIFALHFLLWPGGRPYDFTFTWAQPLAVLAILSVSGINYLGVRLGGRIQILLTAVKVAAVLTVIAIALLFGRGSIANFHISQATAASAGGLSGFLTAMVAALWAYDGWANITYVGSEVENPERNIPISLLGGVLLVCGIYIAMTAACFFVLPFGQAAASAHIASDAIARATGRNAATWMTIVMIVSALGALNSCILTDARVDYAMARQGLFFRPVKNVHPRFRTPGGALTFQAIVASLLALTGTFQDLYSLFIFAAWIFYGLQTMAVIWLRVKKPDLRRPYRTWGYPFVPIVFVIGALALTINLWIERPLRSSIGMALILSGLFFYVHWRKRLRAAGLPT